MCGGMLFAAQPKGRRVYFPIPMARIDAVISSGESVDAVWGRRSREEFSGSPIPVTGWARLESLKAGTWNRFSPSRALVAAAAYMEKDRAGTSHWFDVPAGSMLAAIMLSAGEAPVVYMVTRPAPEEFAHIHDRWVLPITDPEAYFTREAS